MGTKKTIEEREQDFIEKLHENFGNAFIYEKGQYVNNRTKVIVKCIKCGKEHYKKPTDLTDKTRYKPCECMRKPRSTKKLSDEALIERCYNAHRDNYRDYKVVRKGTRIYIEATCPIHGTFQRRYESFTSGGGCPHCSGKLNIGQEEFIRRAREIHGDKYDYSKVEYINGSTNVCIICPIHGEFLAKTL